jgi:tripartite-type tricarboxylate transporter receptor subunit TctC
MKKTTRRQALKIGLAAPFVLQTGATWAQQPWPSRPIHLIVPFGAGGAVDTVCRLLGAKISEKLKQNIIIENKTGGNTMVASSAALQMPKDGYAFLVTAAQYLINPILMTNLPLDFATDFTPVVRIAAFPQVIAVRSDFPAQTIAEYISHAKANPGKVSYGTPPAAGMAHMAGALIQSKTGIKLNHAPYRLATEAVRDVAGGNIDSVLLTTSTIQPALQSQKARVLAVTSAERVSILPDAPTISETIIPGFQMDDWFGMFAETGVPDSIQQRMQDVVIEVSKDPAVIERLRPLGSVVLAHPKPQFQKFLDEQRTVLAHLIMETGIKLD